MTTATTGTKPNIRALAEQVIARGQRIGIDEAIQVVLGEYNDRTANLYQEVFDEVQNIQYPHGSGEDASYCEF